MTLTVVLVLALFGNTPGVDSTARFQATFLEGEALYQKGEYRAAIEQFLVADSLRSTPEAAYNLAKSFDKLQDEARAVYYYRLYLRRAPRASDRAAIEKRLNQTLGKMAQKQLGYLEVEAQGARWVKIGDTEYRQLPVSVFLPEGPWNIEAVFPNRRETATVNVLEGLETAQVFVSTPNESTPWLSKEKSTPSPVLRQASYWVWGTAALALVTGAIAGNMSTSDASLLQRRQDLTVTQAQALTDSANRNGRTANALWLTSGALTLAGAGLFVVTLPEPSRKEASP